MPLEFLVITLVVWRISSLLTAERGPFDVLGKFRDAVGVKYDEMSRCVGKNEVASTLCCIWCTSVWIGLMAGLLFFTSDWLLYGLALSAGAIVVERIVSG